jgi:predicted RNA-binding protein with PUA-like domain
MRRACYNSNMNYWLVKSEGECYSIDDLKRDTEAREKSGKKRGDTGAIPWEGIRNFQARNFMRDCMKVGDLCLFYHSSGTPAAPSGVYGIARVASAPHIDESALNPKDEHFDPKAVKYVKEGKPPMWVCVDMEFLAKFTEPVYLTDLKREGSKLGGMLVLQPGQRLSVMPVSKAHYERVMEMTK